VPPERAKPTNRTLIIERKDIRRSSPPLKKILGSGLIVFSLPRIFSLPLLIKICRSFFKRIQNSLTPVLKNSCNLLHRIIFGKYNRFFNKN
jgi:hypothetical protein